MTDDLRQRLQAALGAEYRLERELGGGGMSRVFLAEETALGRRVVIKLLPPELAAVLSADRFQREVRLAARLQHPHVVPLLAAGQAGDILYYTMPFIEGESLRARLDREHELPIAEAVRLLREVTDALAYAHREGLVHRDIKPDNILLSHQHAVVTDFGIAKALSAAGDSGTLTATGVAIGTPAYMAPEQATGEAQVDHRADLYSLGALAYEMLAGEPPFRGATAQALIAAQLTRTPTPLVEARPAVPPDLAAAIHRCLEKRPADRFQRAEELLAALDALAPLTPTGLRTTAPGATEAPGAREWPLPQVLAYFALAGAAILGVAWALRTLAGLPDWFFPAAVVLLALGLPVVVLAVITHNRRVAGRTAVSLPIPGKFHHGLTLAKAITGGIASFSALALVTGGYMAMRLLGIGPVGSLVASGKLTARERLIIADFANQTRDPLLGPAVTQAFRVDFSQSKLVSPVEADYVRRVLKRMQRPDTIPVGLAVAREIAQREGWKAVVAGELQQVGPNVLVSAQLVNAESGEVLASVRETARDSTGILEAVDRVSKRLREKIGESLRSIRANPPLADVTTGSLDALRNYSEALRDVYEGDNARAITLLEEAVVQDSTFGMAWRKLGTMLVQSGERSAQGVAALTRAFQLRDRLTFRERKLTEDSYYMDVTGAVDSATGALQSLLAEYPNDSWALNNIGVMYEVSGNKVAAEQSYLRAAALEPESALIWGNIFSVRIGLAQYDSAASTLKLMKERFPAGALMDEREVTLLAGRRDFAAAEARMRELVERYRSDPRAHGRQLHLLGGILGIRGKLAEADRTMAQASELFAGRGLGGIALAEQALRVSPIAMYRGDRRAAAARLDEALRAAPLERLSERDRPLMDLIVAAAAAGQQDRAKALLAEFERNPGNTPGRVVSILRIGARARVLGIANESLPQALPEYRRAGAAAACGYCNDAPMANAFDRAGMPDSARFYYQRWADAGEWLWDSGIFNFWPPVAYFRLAELYQQKSDTVRAMEFYGKFAELWKEADPELQPRVKEARRRMAELVAEPRRP
jgi:tRNA A-37 threonylcarbamoyl transferase component Bud32/tetratricopeptide (TPR) repeat protein